MQGSSTRLPKIQRIKSWEEEKDIISNCINQKARSDRALNILEAGCGTSWGLHLEGTQYILTGVDIDKKVLAIRNNQKGDLDKAILGDLRTVILKENEYDVIYNSYVLEHVDGAECVLSNFIRWLKPGGILILIIPDRDAVHGFLTRITPFWIHVFYKKHVQGFENAGKPGYGPFTTFYDKVVSRNGIHGFCKKHGLVIRAEYGLGRRPKKTAIFLSARLFVWIIHLISLGRLTTIDDIAFVIEKP